MNQQMKAFWIVGAVILAGAALAWIVTDGNRPGGNKSDGADGEATTTPSGLKYIDVKVGDGREAKKGNMVVVHYTGRLKNGKKFDSSVDSGKPFPFPLGAGRVIKGWDEGVAGMKEGGKRKLIIPPELGYGPEGAGADIPPNSELHFDVELLSVGSPGGGGGFKHP